MNQPPRKPAKRNTPGGGSPRKPRQTNPTRARHQPATPRHHRTPRDAVLELLRDQAARWPDLDITQPDTDALDPRDAAFAHALYDQCIRRWLTCRFLIERHLSAPWNKTRPEPKAALIAGTAQLLFMRSVPAHAAVNESVGWTRNRASKHAAGLVNAVLRRVADDIAPPQQQPPQPDRHNRILQSGVTLNITPQTTSAPKTPAETTTSAPNTQTAQHKPAAPPEPWNDRRDALPLDNGSYVLLADHILPEDPLERLAVATSHPVELLAEWIKHTPIRELRHLALHGLARPPVILNTQTATLSEQDLALLTPHQAPGHHVFTNSHNDLTELLTRNTSLWVQDPASSLAVQAVADLTPSLVIDYCAGNGTKTQQLAAAFPNARIIATDIDRPRYHTLERAFADTPNVETRPFDDIIDFAGKADLVLIDAPCSNTGVLARRVEARYRAAHHRTDELTNIQRQLIADSIRLLNTDPRREPGRILYSTCSLDPAENEQQAAWAKRWHNLEPTREHRRPPSGGPGQPPETYSDGSYAVLLA